MKIQHQPTTFSLDKGVCRDRSGQIAGFFLPVKVRSLPGPQVRGTGGTLSVVWKGHRARGHPPDAWLLAVAQAAEGVLVTFDKALGPRGARCLLPKRG